MIEREPAAGDFYRELAAKVSDRPELQLLLRDIAEQEAELEARIRQLCRSLPGTDPRRPEPVP